MTIQSSPKKVEYRTSVPLGKKYEMILKLAKKIKELQNQHQLWTEWATKKIMQAAQKLSKDKAELQTLREKQFEEDNKKKLSQLENAVNKTKGKIELANAHNRSLEEENSRLRKQVEAAKLQAVGSAAGCAKAFKKEKETTMLFQTSRKQKTLLQDELAFEKQKSTRLQHQMDQAIKLRNKFESKSQLAKNATEELLIQATSLRKERQQIEASAKSKEEMAKNKAQSSLQKYKDNIEKLKAEISQIRSKAEASRIDALKKGMDESYDSTPTYNRSSKMPMKAKENSVIERITRDRECVMCLSKEKSVVFLPCAHQEVCKTCNGIHEKQGLKDCPSCRTPIQERICVRYALS